MAFFLLALDRMGQALRNALEHVFGGLGGFQLVQHVEEQHRVPAEFVGVPGDVLHELLGLGLQARDGVFGGAFLDQLAARQQVHLAPFARLGQHAARRHQAVGHAQAFVAHFAGETQEDAAFHLDQLDAAAVQFELALQPGVVVFGVVGRGMVAVVTHGRLNDVFLLLTIAWKRQAHRFDAGRKKSLDLFR